MLIKQVITSLLLLAVLNQAFITGEIVVSYYWLSSDLKSQLNITDHPPQFENQGKFELVKKLIDTQEEQRKALQTVFENQIQLYFSKINPPKLLLFTFLHTEKGCLNCTYQSPISLLREKSLFRPPIFI